MNLSERLPMIPREKILNLLELDDICIDEKHMASQNPYVRRTITIAPNINRWIQDLRGKSLQYDPTREYDYTSVVNYLMAIGINSIQRYRMQQEDIANIANLRGDLQFLKIQGFLDMYEDVFRRRQRQQAPNQK